MHEFNHYYSNTRMYVCMYVVLVFNLNLRFLLTMTIFLMFIMSRQGCKHRLREFPITIRDHVIWHVLTQTRYAGLQFQLVL